MTKQEAISRFGSIKALADVLGITREAIYQWGDVVPALRAYEIRDLLAKRQTADTNAAATPAA